MKTAPRIDPSSFRDHLATADQAGQRIWVYPVKPRGRLYRARTIVAFVLLAFFFIAPFLKLNGEPLILFDILGRRFLFFGLIFRPQDLYLLVLAILTFAVFVLQFTAIFGRLFCGWTCPQTIFMEMVFRRIEYWIDGSPYKQRKLREGPWTPVKISKWLLKQSVFFVLSFVICNFILSYFVGMDELRRIVTDPPSQHLIGLIVMLIFALVFCFVFSWFREQACTIVCPYGRLQGALIDSNSIIVAYDYQRGEPRAKRIKGQDRSGKGDCVDCRACLAVCPTGIDIRNGTQLECVNCTACIDACNAIMRKVGTPEGLIRYTSEDKLAGHKRFRWTGRVIIYSVALAALVLLLSFLLVSRADIETTILRMPGTSFYETDDGNIRNLYSLKIINKTFEPMPIELRLKGFDFGSISMVKGNITLEGEGIVESAFFVDIPRDELLTSSTPIVIEVMRDEENVIEEVSSFFIGPDPGGSQ